MKYVASKGASVRRRVSVLSLSRGIFHCHYRPSARQFITRAAVTKRYFISMQRARTRGQSPWIRTFTPTDYKLQYRGAHVPFSPSRSPVPRRCRHRRLRRRRRRRRRRRSAVSRRWQIINIHYVLTKLSHKLRARGKNGTADNGRADKQPDETDATVHRCSVRCSNVCLS